MELTAEDRKIKKNRENLYKLKTKIDIGTIFDREPKNNNTSYRYTTRMILRSYCKTEEDKYKLNDFPDVDVKCIADQQINPIIRCMSSTRILEYILSMIDFQPYKEGSLMLISVFGIDIIYRIKKYFILAFLLDSTKPPLDVQSQSFSASSIQEVNFEDPSQISLLLPSNLSFLHCLGRDSKIFAELEETNKKAEINILDFKLIMNYIQGYFTYFFIDLINKDFLNAQAVSKGCSPLDSINSLLLFIDKEALDRVNSVAEIINSTSIDQINSKSCILKDILKGFHKKICEFDILYAKRIKTYLETYELCHIYLFETIPNPDSSHYDPTDSSFKPQKPDLNFLFKHNFTKESDPARLESYSFFTKILHELIPKLEGVDYQSSPVVPEYHCGGYMFKCRSLINNSTFMCFVFKRNIVKRYARVPTVLQRNDTSFKGKGMKDYNYVKEDKMITRSQFQGQQHYRLHLEDREMAFAHMCNVLLSFLKYQRSDQIRILDSLISERKQAILGRLFGEIDDHVENDSFDKVMPELNPVKMITKSLK
ncbi:unnamed protein product [Moneuplotes crassus]|uniref:Uncharacterized protein n=1 Tax=Euplotes crassus TaxID=5936 RepID=A0AAD1U5M9_EUPCR|nr:unnamed protein product [Moneuplotes crassus]